MSLLPLLLALSLLAPQSGADKLEQARARMADGKADEAERLLSEMLAAGEGDAHDVRLLLADAQLAAGAPDRALETLEPIAKDDDPAALRKMGEAFRANGERVAAGGGRRAKDDAEFQFGQAVTFLVRAGKAGDAAADAQAGFVELYNLGDADAARERADKLLKRDAQDGEALLLRGCAHVSASWAASQAGDEKMAKAEREKAVADLTAADAALGGKRPEPVFQLAWLHEQSGEAEKAVEAAAAWSDRLPHKDFSRLYQLARRYAGERQLAAASSALVAMVQRDAALLTEWVKAEEDVTAAAVSLSWGLGPLVDSNRGRVAKDVLAALCAAGPKDPNLWNDYGLMARDANAFDESLRAYDQALVLRPDDANLMNDTAVILHYYLHRDYDRAQELYEKAIEIADELLDKRDKLTPEALALAEKAKKEATDNMRNLAQGVYEWGR